MKNITFTIVLPLALLAILLIPFVFLQNVNAKGDQNTKTFGQKSGNSALIYQTQKRLKDLGYDPGPIDGMWGGKTQRAVKEFQKGNDLSATGQLDEETKIKLGLKESARTSDEEKWEAFRVFGDVLELLKKEYYRPVSTKEMIIETAKWLVDSLDQKSQLYTPEDLAELAEDKSAATGIGVQVVRENDFFEVVATIPGTPARKYGIRPGDKIVMINGKATLGKRKDEIVKMLRGPIGSELKITMYRDKLKELIDLKIIRDAPAKVEAVFFKLLEPGYGYLRLSSLDKGASSHIKNTLEKTKEEGRPLKGLILDLRNSSGGLLIQAVKISDIFLDKEIIVRIHGRHKGNIKIFKASSSGTPKKDFPIVVLINSGTLSGSEIIAAALQDNKRAILLGAKSSGNGSIQTIETLPGGFAIKLTIARFFTPNGQRIEKKGIDPNILIDSSSDTSLYPNSIPSVKNDVILKTAYQVLKNSPSSQFEDLLSTAEKILKEKERLEDSKASISDNENAKAEVKYVTDILNLTLRAGPGSDEKIIGIVKTGQEFEIIQAGDNWTRVKLLTGNQGWILTRFIVPSPYLLFDNSSEYQNRVSITDTMKLTVREGPGTKYKILSIVESRQQVAIISAGDEWSLVRASDGKEGWVLSRYLIDYPNDRWCVEGDCQNGFGRYISPIGGEYEGFFRDGRRYGKGIITYNNGARYAGKFRDDRKHGTGTFHSPDGEAAKFNFNQDTVVDISRLIKNKKEPERKPDTLKAKKGTKNVSPMVKSNQNSEDSSKKALEEAEQVPISAETMAFYDVFVPIPTPKNINKMENTDKDFTLASPGKYDINEQLKRVPKITALKGEDGFEPAVFCGYPKDVTKIQFMSSYGKSYAILSGPIDKMPFRPEMPGGFLKAFNFFVNSGGNVVVRIHYNNNEVWRMAVKLKNEFLNKQISPSAIPLNKIMPPQGVSPLNKRLGISTTH